MVAEHHPLAGRKTRIQGACRIGEDEAGDALRGHPADAGTNGVGRVAFVEVDAAFHQKNRCLIESAEDELPIMTGHG